MLAELGESIKKEIDSVRLICIAGPSSSGKTTFCNRLRIELMSRGINPVMISMDDYYLSKEEIAKIQNKTNIADLDLEHINCLDIKLFNQNLFDLINGDEVTLPHYNFQTGKREAGRTLKIDDKSPIMIEGIHALNEKITESIPKHQKYKVYIAPQIQINIDDHSPLSTTDLRLIRRIVRDMKFRNSPADSTIRMWQSVRNGEFKWIYPNQEGANYVFNSELSYEMCVFKKYALPALLKITPGEPEYVIANRLIKYLKYFKDIDDESAIPCNSLIREFIGGSCFNV
jgi:uridine kinase